MSARSELRSDRGAAAVEFALILPLLILLLMGIVQFGRVLNTQITLTGAAREGVRVMAIQDDAVAARAATIQAAPSLNPPLAPGEIAVSGCSSGPYPSYTVTATRTVSYSIPLWGQLTIPLNGEGVMRCGG
jgi:Flp pilus assembly protein TadG